MAFKMSVFKSPPVQKAPLKNQPSASVAYVSNVLKSQFGNSEEFLMFERNFYYQLEELGLLRNATEQLRASVTKLQEEKRSLELQLVSEKAARQQEAKNASMEIEKNGVEKSAQIYSIKCETESWKRKAEAAATECNWMKDQMKTIELEKNQAVLKLSELKSNLSEFERCRQSFDTYAKRQKELVQLSQKKLEELEKAKDQLSKITENNQKQLDMMSSQLRNWNEERTKSNKRIAELEKELLQTKAESVQNNAKLERVIMKEKQAQELIKKLMEENKDLRDGLTVLTKAVGEQIDEADKQLIEKTALLHQHISETVQRICDPSSS